MFSVVKSIVSVCVFAAVANSAAIPHANKLVARGAGKRGLAFNDQSLCSLFDHSAITWAYDWGQQPVGTVRNMEYVPMLWGEKMFPSWKGNADKAIANGAKHMLAFNEPDLPSQAYMSPDAAASAYVQHMNPYAGKARLGAPAVSNSGSPNQGLDWLRQFMSACRGRHCEIDFVPVHWYDSTGNVDYFKKHMREAYEVAGKPIWLTEFGMLGSPLEAQIKLFREVAPWMDQQPWIERYAYFGVIEGFLIQNGGLSALGQLYNGNGA